MFLRSATYHENLKAVAWPPFFKQEECCRSATIVQLSLLLAAPDPQDALDPFFPNPQDSLADTRDRGDTDL